MPGADGVLGFGFGARVEGPAEGDALAGVDDDGAAGTGATAGAGTTIAKASGR